MRFFSPKKPAPGVLGLVRSIDSLLSDPNPHALESWRRAHATAVDSNLIGALRLVAVRLLASNTVGDTEQPFRLKLVMREIDPLSRLSPVRR